MKVVGKVESLWRYPVKSMRGEELEEAFAGFSGIYGDRVYAFRSSAAPKGFPYLTGREQESMLLYCPKYRNPDRAAKPVNLVEAEAIGTGLTPLYGDISDFMVDVETPRGEQLPIDDPRLISLLREGIPDNHELTLLRSDRAMTDCRPVSILSVQTAHQLGREAGMDIDKRRFRANVFIELESGTGFGEDHFVGRTLCIGKRTTISVLSRDGRCKMITLDPETAQPTPELMKRVAHQHDGKAGVYGAVLVEGMIRRNDPISMLE